MCMYTQSEYIHTMLKQGIQSGMIAANICNAYCFGSASFMNVNKQRHNCSFVYKY